MNTEQVIQRLKEQFPNAVQLHEYRAGSVHLVLKNANYSIRVTGDYLGCIATLNYFYPGEAHHRGNDLHDGKNTEETWETIVKDIKNYEDDIHHPNNPANSNR